MLSPTNSALCEQQRSKIAATLASAVLGGINSRHDSVTAATYITTFLSLMVPQ